MPKHGCGANAVDDNASITSVEKLVTLLMTVKWNLLKVGLFSGCGKDFHLCLSLPTGCYLLKVGVQCLMDDKEILFEKTPVTTILL